MEGIGILHGKFTHTEQTCSRSRLITEFCLDLIDHKRILGVGVRIFSYQMYRCLLVSHSKNHAAVVAVTETHQLRADTLKSSGLLPEGTWKHNREHHFLAVDRIHLFADDPLDLGSHPFARSKQRIDTVCHILDISALDHQRMAVDHAVGGLFFESFTN